MARAQGPQDPQERNRLTVTRSQAVAVLSRHAEEGRDLLGDAESVVDDPTWTEWSERFDRWRSVTKAALRKIYSTNEPSEEFDRKSSRIVRRIGQSDGETFRYQQDVIPKGVNVLAALIEGLEYVDAPEDSGSEAAVAVAEPTYSRAVFVVHGRDDGLRESVARTLERLSFEPLILSEQPNQGATLIEKFERNALQVGFAVVILSPDDYGRGSQEAAIPSEPNRARQNVVLELGYFMGKLGRSRVAALYRPGTELPSDIHGLGYVPIDDGDAWRFKLAGELAAAGYDVDFNRLRGT
jgi:predicted nucleotide-binding protein